MANKSRFVGVRMTPEQQHKLVLLSLATSEPGNLSAGLRWAVDAAKVQVSEVHAVGAGLATQQAESEAGHG